MTGVHLVRHGQPVEDLRSSGVLPDDARWFSSPDPEAMGTARLLTSSSVTVYDALRDLEEGETHDAARHRIARGVRALRDMLDAAPMVVVSHGAALTLLVADLTDTEPDDAAWQRPGTPDHCCLVDSDAPGTFTVAQQWGSWR